MIGIISDIHGNHVALAAVLAELDRAGVTEIICLGDVGGYYCEINECCETLRARKIFCLLGNHDWYLTANEECPRSNSANRCLEYQRKVITPENLMWLSTLRSQATVHGLEVVHGGWNDPLDEYLTPTKSYFANIPGSFFASGHTHVQCLWSEDGKTYCNPGSVGQPRDGDARAGFAIWDKASFSLHRTAYDIALIQQKMATAGFDPYFYENLSKGAQIGGRISRHV